MYLNSFAPGTNINLSVSVKGQVIKLYTEIIKPVEERSLKYGYGIICKPVIVNNRIIDTKQFPVTVDIYNQEIKRGCRFKASICVLDIPNQRLIIFSHFNAELVENRHAFRIPCIYKTVLKFTKNTRTIDCRTHDLSYIGGSFVVDKEKFEGQVGDEIRASIFDDDGHVYKINGRIARIIEDFNPELVFVGVRFKEDKIRGLISRLQIRETRLRKS